MPPILDKKHREYFYRAAQSRRKAELAADPDMRHFWLEMERKWLGLAQSYEHVARTEILLKSWGRRIPDVPEVSEIQRSSAPDATDSLVQDSLVQVATIREASA